MMKLIDGLFRLTKVAAVRVPLARARSKNETTLDVPGYMQLNSYCCGATAGFMVLKYFLPNSKFGKFYDYIHPRPESGSTWKQLRLALDRCGVECGLRRALGFKDIKREIERAFPIIVAVQNPGMDHSHFVVIYGYGTSPDRVFIAVNGCPIAGQEYSLKDFLKLRVRGQALVCWGRRAWASRQAQASRRDSGIK